MIINNFAYSKEYQEHRRALDFVFADKFITEVEEIHLSDNKHVLKVTSYIDESHETLNYNLSVSKTEVFNMQGEKVAEFKNLYHKSLYSLVEHSNGKQYLFFSIDLYGYSILVLTDYKMYHYIPEESFKGQKETFIWTEVYYCKKNNILAVDGCYWACPYSTLFVDFSDPEKLPYKTICSTYDLADEIDIDTDATPVRWNDEGTIVLSCSIAGDEKVIEKSFSIESRKLESRIKAKLEQAVELLVNKDYDDLVRLGYLSIDSIEDIKRVIGEYSEFWDHVGVLTMPPAEAVEFFEPASPVLAGEKFIGLPFSEARKIAEKFNDTIRIDGNGFTSEKFGYGVYVPFWSEEDDTAVEAVIVFRKGYYG